MLASTLLISQSRVYGQETQGSQVGKFTADLQPRASSNATGKAVLQTLPDLKTISYSINASGMKDIKTITISQNGPTGPRDVVVIHTASSQGIMQGPQNGTVATGNFTQTDLVGPLAGKRMADFVKGVGDGTIVITIGSTAYPAGELGGKLSIG